MEKERGLTKRKIEETGVNQQPKCKSQAIFLSFYFKSSFNLSGLINIDILNLLAYKQICALYFTKLILPSSNKIFGMQLIATDNNLDSSRSLYKQTNTVFTVIQLSFPLTFKPSIFLSVNTVTLVNPLQNVLGEFFRLHETFPVSY